MTEPNDAIDYIRAFKAATARQNDGARILAWINAGVTAEEAAAWAELGWYPGESQHLRDQGITPAMAAAMEQAETEVAGGEEQLAMQRVDDLVQGGAFVDPSRVTRTVDPDDPNHEIITIHGA